MTEKVLEMLLTWFGGVIFFVVAWITVAIFFYRAMFGFGGRKED